MNFRGFLCRRWLTRTGRKLNTISKRRYPAPLHRVIGLLLGLTIVGLMLGACSSGSSSENEISAPSDVGEDAGLDLSACRSADASDSISTVACEDKLFVDAVRGGQYEGLDDISDEELASFARGLCSYGEAISTLDRSQLPFFGDLVASTANSWDVSPAQVNGVYQAAALKCPEEFEVLEKLPRSSVGMQFELRAMGTGTANINYLLPGGAMESLTNIDLPWSQILYLEESTSLILEVQPQTGATAGCQITVNNAVIDETRIGDGPADCDVTTQQMDEYLIGERGSASE